MRGGDSDRVWGCGALLSLFGFLKHGCFSTTQGGWPVSARKSRKEAECLGREPPSLPKVTASSCPLTQSGHPSQDPPPEQA